MLFLQISFLGFDCLLDGFLGSFFDGFLHRFFGFDGLLDGGLLGGFDYLLDSFFSVRLDSLLGLLDLLGDGFSNLLLVGFLLLFSVRDGLGLRSSGHRLNLKVAERVALEAHLHIASAVFVVEAESDVVDTSCVRYALRVVLLEVSFKAFLVHQALLDTFIAGDSLLSVTFVALPQLLALSGDNVSNLLFSVTAEDVPSESHEI